jgi:hypothetical protein
MRRVIEHNAFAKQSAGLGKTYLHAITVLAANQFDLAFGHNAQPLAWRRFVEKVVATCVGDQFAALDDSRQFVRFDSNAVGGFDDSTSIKFHVNKSAGV